MGFFVPLFNEFLSTSHLIELLAKPIIENKDEVRIISSKNNEIGFDRYLKRTTRSLFGRFKISDKNNFGHF